jgi:hypothetical protein
MEALALELPLVLELELELVLLEHAVSTSPAAAMAEPAIMNRRRPIDLMFSPQMTSLSRRARAATG